MYLEDEELACIAPDENILGDCIKTIAEDGERKTPLV